MHSELLPHKIGGVVSLRAYRLAQLQLFASIADASACSECMCHRVLAASEDHQICPCCSDCLNFVDTTHFMKKLALKHASAFS